MRIVFVGQKGIPAQFGGVERHVDMLSRELVRRGHDVTVYVRPWYTPTTMTTYEGVHLVHISSWHTKHFDAITHTFLSLMHAITVKPDVIHIHGVGPALLAWIPRLFSPRTTTVVTFHCIDRLQQKWGWFARLMLRLGERAACIFPHVTVVVSRVLEHYCEQVYRAKPVYITNGVSLPQVRPGALMKRWRLEKEKYVLFLGRLVPHKGVHHLIDAWRKLKARADKAVAGYSLVIAGGSHFTDNYVEALHAQARFEPSIIFTDWVHGKEVAELVGNCALFVHPSGVEGLPIAVLEAMAAGRPVIVSDILEHREVLPDERFWYRYGKINDLAKSIATILTSPTLRAQAREFNLERIRREYSWNHVVNELEEVYRRRARGDW